MRQLKRFSALVLLLCLMSTGLSSDRVAAAGRQVGGVTVSPAFQQITLSDSKPTVNFDFKVTNNTSAPLEFALSTTDFGNLDESGGVLFIGQQDKSLNYKYGLSQFMTLGRDHIVVDPKSTASVPITVTDKLSMSPGGHYGAVLLQPVTDDDDSRKVQINQVISSLIFITKQDGAVYNMTLHDYSVATHVFSTPGSVDLRFQNAGNVHVIPRGVAILTDPRGNVVKKGFINAGSGLVMPETFRRMTIPLETMGVAWLPGIYHLAITYRYEGESKSHTMNVDFLYINGWYIITLMILLAGAIALLLSKRFRRLVFAVLSWPGKQLRKLFFRPRHRA